MREDDPGFPNFFMLAGPNTGIGHTSLVVMIEAQVAHLVGACAPYAPVVRAWWTCAPTSSTLEHRGPGQGRADGVELGRVLELVSR